MTDSELLKIGDIVKTLPIFADFDQATSGAWRTPARPTLNHEDGLDEILDLIANALEPRLYETAYAMAVEVAAADLHVEQEELRFLQMLRDRLDLDKLDVAAIERSARVRYRRM